MPPKQLRINVTGQYPVSNNKEDEKYIMLQKKVDECYILIKQKRGT